jgi:hypothetical protein
VGTEIIEIIEVANNPAINTWLLAGKTAGLVSIVIIAVVALIVIFLKSGGFNKLIDLKIQKLGLSTSFNKDVLKRIDDSIDRLLENDEHTKSKINDIEIKVGKNTEAIKEIKADIKDVKIETLKKAILDKKQFLIDRMAAGIRYLLEGCNSELGNYLFTQLCFEDLPMWNGLCKLMGAIQYWKNEEDRPRNWKSEFHTEKT